MIFEIQYHEAVFGEDIPRLSSKDRDRAKKAIEDKLTIHPDIFGKPLRRSLKGYLKLRVGDYRVIFRLRGSVIKIFAIQHRSVVYKRSLHRFEN